MGLPVIRWHVDLTCGHCFEPIVFIEGSPNVIINGQSVVRQGDHIPPHCCGKVCHVGAAIGTSAMVFANNKKIQVQTDGLTCGDTSCHGSPDTFCPP